MGNTKTCLLPLLIALSNYCLQARTELSETAKNDVRDFLNADSRLKKAKQWAEASGILDEMDFGMYGGKITLVLPSNDAFEEFERDHPTWKAKIVGDKSDIETLLLFASTDHKMSIEDVKKGAFEEPDSIVSILSEFSSISKDGKLCVAGYTRAVPCSHPESFPCCAYVDLENPIETTNGNIYLIDKVLLPQELIDKLQTE